MTPDDPRHGSEAGEIAHRRDGEDPCASCKEGARRSRKYRDAQGFGRVPALGVRRRIEALQALGHSRQTIAKQMGYIAGGSITNLMREATCTREVYDRACEVFEHLSMVRPEGPRANAVRTWAARYGYEPPLAWDDIDNDPEPVVVSDGRLMDPVVVHRFMGGEYDIPANPFERREITRLWILSGYSLAELERATGWNSNRYRPKEFAA